MSAARSKAKCYSHRTPQRPVKPSNGAQTSDIRVVMIEATNAPRKATKLLKRMGMAGVKSVTDLIPNQTSEDFRSSVQGYNNGPDELSKYDIDRMYNAARRCTLLFVFVR